MCVMSSTADFFSSLFIAISALQRTSNPILLVTWSNRARSVSARLWLKRREILFIDDRSFNAPAFGTVARGAQLRADTKECLDPDISNRR